VKKYFSILIILFSALLLLIGGCSSSSTSTQPGPTASTVKVVDISTGDAFSLIQSNRSALDFVILDVRTPSEFSSGHIARATNIDFYAPDFKDQVNKLDHNKRYLVYCRTGARSAQATQIMLELGFKNLWNLTGGIVQWTTDGYQTTN
jgi:rhodanese-related sulfurtransferase